jgi:hypothetical protein
VAWTYSLSATRSTSTASEARQLTKVPVILCTAEVWELKKRAKDLEQIAGVHVRTTPFDMHEMCALIQRLLTGGVGAAAEQRG